MTTFRETKRTYGYAINGLGAIYCFMLMAGLVGVIHILTLQKVMASPSLLDLDAATGRRISLIHLLTDRWWIPMTYVALGCCGVLFSVSRNHPRWTPWLWVGVLIFPWIVYCQICAHLCAALLALDNL